MLAANLSKDRTVAAQNLLVRINAHTDLRLRKGKITLAVSQSSKVMWQEPGVGKGEQELGREEREKEAEDAGCELEPPVGKPGRAELDDDDEADEEDEDEDEDEEDASSAEGWESAVGEHTKAAVACSSASSTGATGAAGCSAGRPTWSRLICSSD